MKTQLLKCFVLILITCQIGNAQVWRFYDEVFPDISITKTTNIVYGQNYSILTGAPTLIPLTMDVYQPGDTIIADPLAERPLIIYMHTGSYLPIIYNQGPTGSKSDSATVEICMQFARRGYVVASIDYRLGWDLLNSDQDVRTGTLMQAAYRSIQDAKACVRYFKANYDTGGNDYSIDTSRIILCGQGTGGYVAMSLPSLDDTLELQLPKFISSTTNPAYGLTAGYSYVNHNIWGDIEGYGGNPAVNYANNTPGYSSKIHFAVNIGGAMPDSSWMEAGDVPIVSLHIIKDPFAPYGHGPVYVPVNPPLYVVDVDGSEVAQRYADTLGNNSCFSSTSFSDPYSQRASTINGGHNGLFPFETDNFNISGVWEWYDSTALVNLAIAMGLPASYGTSAYVNGLATNPTMSKTKALAYIDSIQGFVNPRIIKCLVPDTTAVPVGFSTVKLNASQIQVFPNPASDRFVINSNVLNKPIQSVSLFDVTGRLVYRKEGIRATNYEVPVSEYNNGLYFVKVEFDSGEVVKKISIE